MDTLNHSTLIHGNTFEWALSGISLFVKRNSLIRVSLSVKKG